MYGMDHTGYQTAFGGAFAGGDLATTVMPPVIPGYQAFDLYPNGEDNKGDVEAAKQALTKCGQPNGFATNFAYRAERPREKATAEAFQQALSRVGIKLTLKPYPQGDYFSAYAGNPPFVVKNNLGLVANGWGADWNDGFGFLSQIVDSRVIRPTGGSSNTSVPDSRGGQDARLRPAGTGRGEAQPDVGRDRQAGDGGSCHLPGVYAKSLLLRPKNATNLFVPRRLQHVRLPGDGSPEVDQRFLSLSWDRCPEPVEGIGVLSLSKDPSSRLRARDRLRARPTGSRALSLPTGSGREEGR